LTKRARRQKGRIPQSRKGGTDLFHTCAWCKRQTRGDEACYGLGAKVREGIAPRGQDGPFIHLELLTQPGRTVHCAVVTEDSEAKKAGWDVVFMACCQECAESLRLALQKEVYIGEVFGSPGQA